MPSTLVYINLTLFCLALSFGTQLIGLAVPGWLYVIIDTSYINENVYQDDVDQHFALWYVVICWNGTCQTKSYEQLQKLSDAKIEIKNPMNYDFTATYSGFPFSRLLEFQIEAVCAMVLVLMGLILERKQKKWFMLYVSGESFEEPRIARFCLVFCYAVISGALILVPTSTFIDVNEDLRELSDNIKLGIPYALVCAGSGGILALLSCLLLVGTMCKSVMYIDGYSSANISVAVHNATDGSNQLVPLVQPRAQTSTGGFTQPVSPGNRSTGGNIREENEVTVSNRTELFAKNRSGGRNGEDVSKTYSAVSNEESVQKTQQSKTI